MRFLLDCDGVLANFGAGFSALAREQGIDYKQPRGWDVFAGMSRGERKQMERAVLQPGFCRSLPAVPGAREMVKALQAEHEVYCVTAFWFDHPTWMAERTAWLEANMGIDRRRVVHTHAKYTVAGDVLVDDKRSHLEAWTNERRQTLPSWREDMQPKAVLAAWCGAAWMNAEDRRWDSIAGSPEGLLMMFGVPPCS